MKSKNTKICRECGKRFHLNGFQPHSRTPDGRMHICKACHHERLIMGRNPVSTTTKRETANDLVLEEIDNRIAVLNRKRIKYIRNKKFTKATLNHIIDSL